MAASAKILADSVSPDGVVLTTLEITFARCVLAEFNTHRMLSRNSASSRAIPIEKMIARVLEDPYIPAWTRNQKGMAGELLDPDSSEYKRATLRWLNLRDATIEATQAFDVLGVHKQDANRALEPWMWHTAIVTATEWDNFDHLRDHPSAHPAIQAVARAMIAARAESTPEKLDYGQWHMPLLLGTPHDGELSAARSAERERIPNAMQQWAKISVGRCARVSYLTHDGKRDPVADVELHDKLLGNGHMSPLEHVARPASFDDSKNAMARVSNVPGDYVVAPEHQWFGNFRGWVQYRKTIPYEHDMLGSRPK